MVNVTSRPLYSSERPGTQYRSLGGPQGRPGRVRKTSPPPGFDPRTVQPVASNYTDWAIPAHYIYIYIYIYILHLRDLANCTSRDKLYIALKCKPFYFSCVISSLYVCLSRNCDGRMVLIKIWELEESSPQQRRMGKVLKKARAHQGLSSQLWWWWRISFCYCIYVCKMYMYKYIYTHTYTHTHTHTHIYIYIYIYILLRVLN